MYHGCVRHALVRDGWTITHDPLVIPFRRTDLYVDLGAESTLAAEDVRLLVFDPVAQSIEKGEKLQPSSLPPVVCCTSLVSAILPGSLANP